jgi:2-polyprenyl-3-methyl-5-hydroxy-6-metoxy-1,4-benzoquinol methylase
MARDMDRQKSRIESIAKDYHGSSQSDLHIENLCQQFEIEWLREKIGYQSSVIDLGYGDGVVSPALARFTELTVVEGSEDLCDKARKFLPPSVNVVNEFFENYSPNALADFVVASHVLEHVDEPIQLLRRIRSWIKPDGALIAIVPNKESVHRRIARDMGMISKLDELSNRDLLVGHQRVYGLNELIHHFSEAGFIVEEYRGFFLKPLSNGQMLDWSIPALKSLNEIAATSPPQLCANLAIIGKLQSKTK